MKKLFVTVAAAALTGMASNAMAEDCGTVTVAEMNWASAGAIAQIDKIILGKRLWLQCRAGDRRYHADLYLNE